MTIPSSFVGRPLINVPQGLHEAHDAGMLPMRQTIMGAAQPHNRSVGITGGTWQALPVADGVSDVAMNAYGQNGNPADGAGTWYEWHFGAIRATVSLHFWAIVFVGPNLGKWRTKWNGVTMLDWDLYQAGGWVSVGGYITLTEDPAIASIPRKHTIRMEQLAKNPASGGNFLIITTMCIYGV